MKSRYPRRIQKQSAALPTIAVVGSARSVRESLVLALAAPHSWNIVDSGDGDSEAVPRLVDLHPRVVLVVLSPEEANSLLQRLKHAIPDSRIVAISAAQNEPALLSLIEAGLTGLVLEGESLEEVQEAIDSALRGECHFPPKIIAALVGCLAELHRNGNGRAPRPSVKGRQREVLLLIEQGMTNKEIVTRLGIEAATVKNHVHNILEKLAVHRRGDAASQLREGNPRLGVVRGKKVPL